MFAGDLKPGDKLPSVRDFALQFKVNPNTIQKALGELESEQLIYTERTNGKFITNDQQLIERSRHQYAAELTREYQRKIHEIGL